MKLICVILSCSLMAFSVQAEQKNALKLTMTAMEEIVVVNEQGESVVQLVKPTQIVPGDTVVYTTKYFNQRDQELTNVVIENPIPQHLVYIQNTANQKGISVRYSVDKGQTFGLANKLMVQQAEGEFRLATVADYTHIRWVISMVGLGEKGFVSFKSKLN